MFGNKNYALLLNCLTSGASGEEAITLQNGLDSEYTYHKKL